VHADEFSDAGGARAAARWKAASADHLQHASQEGITAMAQAGVTAILLPGTSLYTAIPYTNARPCLNTGCAVAIASDYNPGSCRLYNLPLLATLASVHCHLSLPQVLAGITYVPSVSLGLGTQKGALAEGFDGDFVTYHTVSTVEQWLAACGMEIPNAVFVKGNCV
jgi:imidazolonepropionase